MLAAATRLLHLWLCAAFQPVERSTFADRARLPCWSEVLTPDLCCGDIDALQSHQCAFDPHFFTKEECCGTGWAVLDPYPLTRAPPVTFPGDKWNTNHPAEQLDQLRWEELMGFAAVMKTVPSPVGPIELWVFKEDTTDVHLYDLESTSGMSPDRILDVGANYGGVAVALARLYPTARIVAAEPNPLLCRFLLWSIRHNGLTDRVWPLCGGVASKDGELLMQVCNQPWVGVTLNTCMNLAMRTFVPNASSDQSELQRDGGHILKVPVLSMMSILNGVGWAGATAGFDLLKLDCEGCEWEAVFSQAAWYAPWPKPRAAVGELHFSCKTTSCWPRPKTAAACTVATFHTLQEMWKLIEKCAEAGFGQLD
eukprot:TRINITY_DN64568_c0_g1_i1.p1 TRINITY_DN64568_c0_g1~~TRINITY_DN64568_c0_g1_i1.p1  ORF type:complete len:396 (-),score=55.89 TRINITY_DN64568_c0_g1_i1:16-1116(-)